MTMVSPSTSMVIVRGNHLIYTIFMIKIPQSVSYDLLLIFVIDLHYIITPHLTSRDLLEFVYVDRGNMQQVCTK